MGWYSPLRTGRAAAGRAAGEQVVAQDAAPLPAHRGLGVRRGAGGLRRRPAAGRLDRRATSGGSTAGCTSEGWVHSVEAWTQEGRLAGGLYGVSIGGLFAGESMFHRPDIGRDASKAALVGPGQPAPRCRGGGTAAGRPVADAAPGLARRRSRSTAGGTCGAAGARRCALPAAGRGQALRKTRNLCPRCRRWSRSRGS